MSSLTGATGMSAMGGATGGNKIPSGYKLGQLQQFTPEQQQLFQRLFSQVSPDSFLSRLASGDQSQFEALERPALKQFGELQGNLASRFSGMGSGARRSSGFQNSMSTAAQDFAERLQSQRLGLQQQALQDLMNMSNQLLNQRPYEQFVTPKQMSFLQQLGLGLAGGAGQLGGTFGGIGASKWAGFI